MFQVIMTTTTTTPSVTALCSGASFFTMIVTLASISLGQIALAQQYVALPPQLIQRDTKGGSAGLTNVLQQQLPQSWMPSRAYAYCAMGPSQVSFSFKVEPPMILMSYAWCVLWCSSNCSLAIPAVWWGIQLWGLNRVT